jgi:hypothetical protein
LDVLKDYFGQPRWVGNEENKKLIPPILDCYKLELQQPLFKLLLISNCLDVLEPLFDINPLTRIWKTLDASTALAAQFPEYIKLAEIALVHVLGSIEDERCFSSLNFVKDRLQNRLSNEHLDLVIGMHGQHMFTLGTFPYDDCFQTWIHSAERYRYNVTS